RGRLAGALRRSGLRDRGLEPRRAGPGPYARAAAGDAPRRGGRRRPPRLPRGRVRGVELPGRVGGRGGAPRPRGGRGPRAPRRAGRSIGLVPTMGALHEGHLSLLRRARERCDVVVASAFVNPAQFGPGEDLEAYPRDPDRDARLAAAEGVDLLFAPPAAEI